MDLYALNNMNLDESTSSSDAADVLIRSTKAVFDQKRQKNLRENMESGLSCHSDVNIYVRRLSDSVHGSCLAENGLEEMLVPPVLPVNTHSASPTGILFSLMYKLTHYITAQKSEALFYFSTNFVIAFHFMSSAL